MTRKEDDGNTYGGRKYGRHRPTLSKTRNIHLTFLFPSMTNLSPSVLSSKFRFVIKIVRLITEPERCKKIKGKLNWLKRISCFNVSKKGPRLFYKNTWKLPMGTPIVVLFHYKLRPFQCLFRGKDRPSLLLFSFFLIRSLCSRL